MTAQSHAFPFEPSKDPPSPVRSRIWRWLRFPVLASSLLFLAASAALWWGDREAANEDGARPLPPPKPAVVGQPGAKPVAAPYELAWRLRGDARRLAREGDYENALERLNQAAALDERADHSPDVEALRRDLRQHIGEVVDDSPTAPSSIPANAPNAGPTKPAITAHVGGADRSANSSASSRPITNPVSSVH